MTDYILKAEELRKGNLVTVHNPKFHPLLKNVPLIVTGVSITQHFKKGEWTDGVSLKHINDNENIVIPMYSQFIEFIRPIPLNRKFLRLFCFIERRYITGIQYSRSIYTTKAISFSLEHFTSGNDKEWETWLDNSELTRIKYVHQLQNLWSDLTSGMEQLQIISPDYKNNKKIKVK